MKKVYNKLVRDKIPSIIESDNKKCNYHFAKEEERIKLLKDKLQEEVNELSNAKTREEVLEEAADVVEVLLALAANNNIVFSEIVDRTIAKHKDKGGFYEFVILESVEEI